METMKKLFLLVLLTVSSLVAGSCGGKAYETNPAASLDNNIYTERPTFNLFVTPEIERQKKYDKISYTKDWFIAYDAAWLDVTPKEGKANETVLLTITTKDEPQEEGQYQTEIRIESKDNAY